MRLKVTALVLSASLLLLPQVSNSPTGSLAGVGHELEEHVARQALHPNDAGSSSHMVTPAEDHAVDIEKLTQMTRQERARMFSSAAHRRWIKSLKDKTVTRPDGTETSRHEVMLESKRFRARECRRQKREGTWLPGRPGRPRLPVHDEETAAKRLKVRKGNQRSSDKMIKEHETAVALRHRMGIGAAPGSKSLSHSSALSPSSSLPDQALEAPSSERTKEDLKSAWEALVAQGGSHASPPRSLLHQSPTYDRRRPVLDLNEPPPL